jgi:hypothetical protein
VNTAAEKMIETVSQQRITASETTHDGENRIHTVTTEKRRKRVCRGKKLGDAAILFVSFFLIWVRRVLRSVITVYVPLFFFTFSKLSRSGCWRPDALRASAPASERVRAADAPPQTISVLERGARRSFLIFFLY